MARDPDDPSLPASLTLAAGRAVLRRAVRDDVPAIAALLAEDQLSQRREDADDPAARAAYLAAFDAIDADLAHDLLVAVVDSHVVATMHVTDLPGLSPRGALRAQIEAVRVTADHRSSGLGSAMIRWVEQETRRRGCALVQLTTDDTRADAHRFYERLGFVASHRGFKLLLHTKRRPENAGTAGPAADQRQHSERAVRQVARLTADPLPVLGRRMRQAEAVKMSLPAGEPAAHPWRVASLAELLEVVVGVADVPEERPRVVAVDGRGASGKSTLAHRLRAAVPGCAMVSTDEVAWHHSFFGWSELLASGVLEPARRGEPVSYRPPAWQERGRTGAIELPAGRRLLLVEGVGAGRRELTDLLDAVVWVQSDFEMAERRGIARDIAQGVNGDAEATVHFWHEWMAEELTFLADQRPWERACAVVAGTPPPGLGPDQVLLAPPPAPSLSQ